MTLQTPLMNDPAWMINIQQHHGAEHQRRIKDVQKYLMVQQIPILAHDILDDAEHGTDHDQEAGAVQDEKIALPRDGDLLGAERGHGAQAVVEDPGDDNEKPEEDNLDSKTGGYDILSELDAAVVFGFGQHSSSWTLCQRNSRERKNDRGMNQRSKKGLVLTC